ncbi:NAD(P)/FAD-dependent oxidoreductase [Streptomyces armeniacus]|uniref:NAD(P)/FAD-dependent oxidoreductase n=1 Tax=Streptomyces armeniacus TaxID=83291 RepID=A0A345XLW5_9ACTN|nr:NAD(P)/FAD-dependent oxidoreductase [Streptomyces armeniacus]AXK32631.1 NAD(P)/FAD-dependent oxidoreductase [Streptomyces armeniacus]
MARIAVTGAGLGAMAAAARLAVAGHEVTVYERTETYGGGVRQYARDGFAFDTGPGLLRLPAVYRDLFVKTGREPLEQCVELTRVDPGVRHHFADGGSVTLPSISRGGIASALDAALGAGSGERWNALLDRARTVWEATRRPLLEEPLLPGADRAAPLGRDPYPHPAARGRGFLRRRAGRTGGGGRPGRGGRTATTLADVAAAELRDPRLVALLESHARAYGLDPAHTPASAVVLPYLEQTFGCWYPHGGTRALARAVYERCVARGVEFRFGAGVRRVREAGGRAAGVELADGRTEPADVVVACGGVPGAGAEAGRGSESGSARFTVLLALRGARPRDAVHRTVVHTPERMVTVLRPDDPALRPDGAHESAVLTTAVPGGPLEAPERLADELVAAADAAGLGLGERVLWREHRTPPDYEAETGSPGGVVPAPALAGADGAFLRAPNRAPLDGLYVAGGWSHPGGGLAHSGMSGALAAGLIVEGDDWRGSQ